MNRIIIIFLIGISFLQCNADLENSSFVRKIRLEVAERSLFKAVIIIPGAGCSGCISYAENFVKNNIDNQQILYIFTKITSVKELKAKLGIGSNIPFNIIMDNENRYAVPQEYEESTYPVIIFLNPEIKNTSTNAISSEPVFFENLLKIIENESIKIYFPEQFEKPNENTVISSLSSRIEYVRLEKTPVCTIDRITKVILDSKRIYISDNNEGIFVFSREGSFLRKIGTKGAGPHEYQSLIAGNFEVDLVNKEILIPDFNGKKVLVYDNSGILKEIVKFNTRIIDILPIFDSLYAVYTNSADSGRIYDQLKIINRKGEEKSSASWLCVSETNFIAVGSFEKFKQRTYYRPPYNDTIFEFTSQYGIKPSIIFELGNFKAPTEIYNDITKWIDHASEYIYNINLFHVNDGIFFSCYLNTNTIMGKFEYPNNFPSIYYFGPRQNGIVDDIDHGPPFNPYIRISDNCIIDILEPIELLKPEYSNIRKESDLYHISNNISVEDNPILRIVQIQ